MLIATIQLPPEAMALEQTLAAEPDAVIEAERIAAHSTHWTLPCLWVSGADAAGVEDLLAADPTVESIVDVERFGREFHYHVKWSTRVQARIDTYVDMKATILSARADVGGWELGLRFAAREQFDEFREHVDAQGHSFELLNLTEPGAPRQQEGNLTPEQRQVLQAAAEAGYFEVPRSVTTRELAEQLDRSHQSLSELLRRGTANLVSGSLSSGAPAPERSSRRSPPM